MDIRAIFGISVLMGFVAFGVVAKIYIWPRVRAMQRGEALMALLAVHMFRYMGLSFLVTGVVSASLPGEFARPAAYGDLIAAVLAIVAVLGLAARASWAVPVVWVFNLWGTGDLLNAFYQGQTHFGVGIGALGAAFYIPTAIVPVLLITHGLIFAVLVGGRR
ncbi:MAG: hypothetical protein ACRD5M_02905 [Candidatus Acidiferrales bacterium]